MKKRILKVTVDDVHHALDEGVPVSEIASITGVSTSTIYRWKAKRKTLVPSADRNGAHEPPLVSRLLDINSSMIEDINKKTSDLQEENYKLRFLLVNSLLKTMDLNITEER